MKLHKHILSIAGLAVALSTAAALAQVAPELPEDENLAAAPAEDQVVANLFHHVPVPEGARPLPQSRSEIAAMPDINLLRRLTIGSRINLNVSEGNNLRMTVTRIERRPDDTFSIRGTLDGIPHSSVLMAIQEDALATDITAPTLQLHYKTRYIRDGIHLVCNIDDMLYVPCQGTATPTETGPNDVDVPEAWEPITEGVPPELIEPGFGERGSCSPTVVFDNMIVYTDVARIAAGGTSAIQAECQLATDRVNEAYENSPIAARMRLVRRYEITYNEVGTYEDHLDRLTGTNGQGGAAPWTTTRTNRDTYNADFCSLWVDDGEYCGLAWCTSGETRAYQVTTWYCAAGGLTHAHEIGHNQGCGHDAANGGCGYSNYAFGWRFNGNSGTQYRTVMAYSPGTRIPYFSNPGVNFDGQPTGTATADNERVIEERKETCANFEFTRWDIFVDAAFGGLPVELGSNDFPYNTIAEGVANIDDYVTGASEYPNLYLKSDFATNTTISKPMTITTCGVAHDIGVP